MHFPGGMAGIAAAVLVIGVAAVPTARAADVPGGHTATTTAKTVTSAPVTAPGTTLYVDFNGPCDDSGPGSQAQPFCTVQAAANVVDPGQTVDVEAVTANQDPQSVDITRSGTPTEPITFEWSGNGPDPGIGPGKQTGKAAVTLQDVHDVTLSNLEIGSAGTDDAIDVIGSSDITLTRLVIRHGVPSTTTALESDEIMIDGASSDVTVSRTYFDGGSFQNAVLAKPGAQHVTLSTNVLYDSTSESGFTLDGTTGATVTSNTLLIICAESSIGRTAIALANGSSGTVQNNVIQPITDGAGCTTPAVGLSVDASSASGVTADYNAFYPGGPSSDYSWAGTSYQDPAGFAAATGQGAHDLTLSKPFVTLPPSGSAAINSANCSAPGELGTDLPGNPWVPDPQATDASAGNGGCNASRGAFAPRDSMLVTETGPTQDATGFAAGTVPYAAGLTITGDATSGWGEPVSFTVNFGDGSSPAPATVGTAVTHTYTTAGEYTIRITATDTSGDTSTDTLAPVYALPDQAPVAGLSAAPDGLNSALGIDPDTANFTASADSTGWEIASADINYGGAGLSFTAPAGVTWQYTYAAPGTHTATITVTDKLGRTSTASATITVGDEPQDVYPYTDYSHSIAAHGLVKIPLLKLEGNDCCARGALVDVIVTGDKDRGYVNVYPDGTPRPDLSTVQFQAGRAAENSTLATGGSTIDFYNGSAGTINLDIVTYGIDSISTTNGYGSYGETYSPVTPVTVLPRTKVAGNRQVAFSVAGLHGVPAKALDVVLDVTASGGATAGSFATYGPSAAGSQFSVTGGYWAKGQQVTNLDMLPINGGKAVLQNQSSGSAYFTAEVVGYYINAGSDSVFLPATPRRLGTVFIGAHQSVTMPIAGKDGIPATGTTAVALDLTASEATASGTIAAYADGTALPFLISASYAPGASVADASIVAVGKDGDIRLYNAGSRTVAVNVDLSGSYYAYP